MGCIWHWKFRCRDISSVRLDVSLHQEETTSSKDNLAWLCQASLAKPRKPPSNMSSRPVDGRVSVLQVKKSINSRSYFIFRNQRSFICRRPIVIPGRYFREAGAEITISKTG